MFDQIQVKGRLLSKKRWQIYRINHLIRDINQGLEHDIDKALKGYNALTKIHQEVMNDPRGSTFIKSWFSDNPLYMIHNAIEHYRQTQQQPPQPRAPATIVPRLNLSLGQINASPRLNSLYNRMETPDSFRSLVEEILRKEFKYLYQIDSLGGENNRVLKITVNEQTFICRLFYALSEELEAGISPKQAREAVQGIDYVVQPYEMRFLEDIGSEQVYLEYSQYFPNGCLEDHFDTLHKNPNTTLKDIQNNVLQIAFQLVDLYGQLRQKNVWYTDLKPSNLLLDEQHNIRLSDAKGLILSENRYVPIRFTNTTVAYITSSAFDDNNLIDLRSVQRTNMACTLYQLLTNELPQQKKVASPNGFNWHLKFNFDQPVFQNEAGELFKDLIIQLAHRKVHQISDCKPMLDSIADELLNHHNATMPH